MCKKIFITGMVQGVGFRPFVKRLADSLQINGYVMNVGGNVEIIAQGEVKPMNEFVHRLISDAPKGARIQDVSVADEKAGKLEKTGRVEKGDRTEKDGEVCREGNFYIRESRDNLNFGKKPDNSEKLSQIPRDAGICENCKRELGDKENYRYGYPFISCVSCGPRYSIIKKLPYDRENITMDIWKMCKNCETEYKNVDNVRGHAQTIACNECGPKLRLYQKVQQVESMDEAHKISLLARAIKRGEIIAIKDIGGYHLVCDPENGDAVARLRQLKGREKKPFAVMFKDVESAREYCEINDIEEKVLCSVENPIVLLKKKRDFAGDVCKKSYETGAMLPGNGLQVLLADKIQPLVMTSANKSGEPIVYKNDEMLKWFEEESGITLLADNDREILRPMDDSVVHVLKDRVQIMRRGRGYVPGVIEIVGMEAAEEPKCIFAAGGDLKSVMGFMRGHQVVLSQYIGDLANLREKELYGKTKKDMEKVFGLTPEIIVKDKHPLYVSGRMVDKISCYENREKDAEALQVMEVQHHRAHAASVIGEHKLMESALCFVWDGTGYGDDGNVWGGEFFFYDRSEFLRIGHLKNVILQGGDESSKNALSSFYSYVANYGEVLEDFFYEKECEKRKKEYLLIKAALKNRINTVVSSSAGRLFDCVSAMLEICERNDYEGQCACELESRAMKFCCERDVTPYEYYVRFRNEGVYCNGDINVEILLRDIYEKKGSCDVGELALRFHCGLVEMIRQTCKSFEDQFDFGGNVVFSGGTFQNRILTELCIDVLERENYKVWINERVPSGDGGIALGQLVMAAMKTMEKNDDEIHG